MVVAAFFLQLLILFAMVYFLGRYFTWFYTILVVLSLFAAMYILSKDTRTDYKILWIILIFSFPFFGGLFCLMYSAEIFTDKQISHYIGIDKAYAEAMREVPGTIGRLKKSSTQAAKQSTYLSNSTGAPVFTNTNSHYIKSGEDLLKSMLSDIANAKRFVFLEHYIIEPGKMWDSILDLLTKKAAEGLDVRIIYDDLGCLLRLPPTFPQEMRDRGISCYAFNRVSRVFTRKVNNRDHRKICVVDGNIGFVGGVNLADEYINEVVKFGHWKDTAIRMEGAAVYSITTMFLTTWNILSGKIEKYDKFAPSIHCEGDGFVQPFTDTPFDKEPVGERLYMSILNRAQKYVYITTPYLIISTEMIAALSIAVKSGVDVRLVLPGIPDKKTVYLLSRSYYQTLLSAGVRIYEYTPGFMHAKTFVSDDSTAVVGSINLDYRSLYHHYESAVWMYGTSSVLDIKEDFLTTLSKCREVTFGDKEFKKIFRFPRSAILSVLRIFSPLF